MSDRQASIWDRIDIQAYIEEKAASESAPTVKEEEPKTPWRRFTHKFYWWSIKALGCLFWIYVPSKLFVGDVDRWVIEHVNPSLQWLVDYRFFFFLAIATVGLFVLRRWIYVGAIVFILFFPLFVAFWYVPRTLARQKTWMPTIGLLNVVWVSFRTIRFTFLATFLFATSSLFIAIDGWRPLQVLSLATLLLLWAALLVRACLASVRPVSFIRAQQSLIAKLQDASVARNFGIPDNTSDPRPPAKMTKAEIDSFVMGASGVVCLYGAGYFMADQLERYRRNGASVVFSAAGIAVLFLQAIAIFTMANFGVYHLSSSQFDYEVRPSFATFVRYSLNSLFPGDINAIQPRGQLATWVSIYAGVSVGIILLTLVVALVFSVRSAREDSSATESIAEMRQKSDEYAAHLVSGYRLPLEQLISRLMEMGGFVTLWFRFVSDTIGAYRKQAVAEEPPDNV